MRRVPLRYEPGLWAMVFPVAMYGVGSRELGAALNVSWLLTLGREEAWPALAIWAVVLLAMAGRCGKAIAAGAFPSVCRGRADRG